MIFQGQVGMQLGSEMGELSCASPLLSVSTRGWPYLQAAGDLRSGSQSCKQTLWSNWGLSPPFSSGVQAGEKVLSLPGSQQGFTSALELEG